MAPEHGSLVGLAGSCPAVAIWLAHGDREFDISGAGELQTDGFQEIRLSLAMPSGGFAEVDTSLAERAYRRLEEAIVTLELRPGSVLTESQLIDLVGVGRTPVREALIRFAQQGLVAILPRKGVVIAGIDAGDVLTALDARTELERLIAREAARHATRGQRETIAALAHGMGSAARIGDPAEYMRLDKRLDATVGAASGSVYAVRAVEPLQALIRRAWFHFALHDDLVEAAGLHVSYAQAVVTGAPDAAGGASDALMEHLRERLEHAARRGGTLAFAGANT